MLRKILLFSFWLSSIALGDIANGPYLQNVTENSITVMWWSQEEVSGTVDYGKTTAYGKKISSRPTQLQSEAIWIYEITLTQLSANTTYHYRISSGKSTSDDFSFKTAGAGNSVKFAVFADIQRSQNHRQIAENIVQNRPDLIVSVGDLPAHGDQVDEWQAHFLNQAQPYLPTIPFYATVGNHDLIDEGLPYYQDIFSLPPNGDREQYYHFNYKNAKYIIIDSFYDFSEGSTQYNWLESVLQQNTQQWTFAFFHKPPYSSGPDAKIDKNAQRYLVPLFEKYHVAIVFNGHSHNYERSFKDGVYYIVTGGGGASLKAVNETNNPFQVYAEAAHHHVLIEIEGDQLNFRAIVKDGRLMDSFSLEHSGAPSPPLLSVSTTILDFGASENEQSFEVRNSGDALLSWNTYENPAESWLTEISPENGALEPNHSETVRVTVNRAGLTDGSYTGTISVTSNGGDAQITVKMEVSTATPLISVNPTEISESALMGGANLPVHSIIVTNLGGGTLSWTACENPDVAWMNLQNTRGGAGDTVLVAFYNTGLDAGTYETNVQIIDPAAGNSPVDIRVALTISPVQSGAILAEFETENSPSLPNPGWQVTTNENAECLLAIVSSSGQPGSAYQLNYQFNVPEGTSTVFVFGEVDVNANTDEDSYWIEMNKQERCNWNGLQAIGNGWRRSWVYDRGNDKQHAFPVHSGPNTLNLYPREKGAFINWLVVTTNPTLNIEEYVLNGQLPPTDPVLAVSPESLEFTATENGANPAIQSVTVTNAGGGTLSWEASEVPEVNWMQLNRLSGGTGDKIQVSVSIAGLSVGEYQSHVQIQAPNATNSPVAVPVHLTVEVESGGEFPEIAVEPAELSFSAIEGGSNPTVQSITVTNCGQGTLAWEATESPEINWMTLTNTSGGNGDPVHVSVNITDLPSGRYSGAVKISDANATNNPATVPVTLTITTQSNPPEILAEFEAEASPGLPNLGWKVTQNEGAECILSQVTSRYSAQSQYQLDYSFEAPEGVTDVYIFAEVDINASRSNDSFWISMNEADDCTWKDLASLGNGWKRAWISNYKEDTQHRFRVNPGLNTLNVSPRVTGGFINWFVVTTDPQADIENYMFSGILAKNYPEETELTTEIVPQNFQFLNNFPNPFNATTQISVDLPHECECSIVIYNTLGQQVRTIFQGVLPAGQHQLFWNSRDNLNETVVSGLYLCQFASRKWHQTIKMMLLE